MTEPTYLDRTTTQLLVAAARFYASTFRQATADAQALNRTADALDREDIFLMETTIPRPVPVLWESGWTDPIRQSAAIEQGPHSSWSDAIASLLDWVSQDDPTRGHDVSKQGERRRTIYATIKENEEGWFRANGKAYWVRKVSDQTS